MEESKKGRNLSVLSFTVILYVLGGAKFQQNGSLFGGSVTFAKPWVLEYAGIALLCFYLYRFLLNSKLFKNVSTKMNWYLTQSPGFRSYVERVIKKAFQDHNAAGQFAHDARAEWRTSEPEFAITRTILERSAKADVLNSRNNMLGTFEFRLSCWRAYYFEFFAGLKAVFFAEFFWDDIFPVFLCAAALGLAAARKFGYA